MASFITLNPTQKDEIIDALTSTSGSSGVASAISNIDANGTGIASAISGIDINNTGIILALQTFNTNILAQLQLLNSNIELFNKNVDSVIWQQQNILGAKNLLKYPYYQANVTINGITFTTDDKGIITANGTATSQSNLVLHTREQGELNDFVLNNGEYKVNGCPSGGSPTTWQISYHYRTKDNQYKILATDFGNGDSNMSVDGDYYSDDSVNLLVVVTIANGVTVNNLTFKPMIRLATINDDTFTPYTMTNQEITKYINSIQGGV